MPEKIEEQLNNFVEDLRKGVKPAKDLSEDSEECKARLMARQLKGLSSSIDENRMETFKQTLAQTLDQSWKTNEEVEQSIPQISWGEKIDQFWAGLRMPQVVPVLASLVILISVSVLGYRHFMEQSSVPMTEEALVAWVNDLVSDNEKMVAVDLQEEELWGEVTLDDLEFAVANQNSSEVNLVLELLEFTQELEDLEMEDPLSEFERIKFINGTLS